MESSDARAIERPHSSLLKYYAVISALTGPGFLVEFPRLLFKYEHHEDVADIFNMRTFYDRLTAPMLRDAARMYLDPRRYVEVTLLPEAK